MPRALTVYYKHKPGGFCRRLKFKIEALLDKDWEVHYIAIEPFPYVHPNLKPHILPTPMSNHDSLLFWIYFFTTAPFFSIWIGIKNNINLITNGSPLYAFFCGPAKWFLRVPMLTLILAKPNFHSESKSITKAFFNLEYYLEKLGLRWSNISLANSWGCGEAWKAMHKETGRNIKILPNHIDAPSFDKSLKRKNIIDEFSLDSNSFVITNTGLLQKLKNLELLIRTIAKVNNKRVILLLVGEGKEKESLKDLAESTGVADQVIFTGWRTDARELVQGSDLFVFPSFSEGMSESLLEATTCQLPCLVSSIPENTDIIQNPEQHFLPDSPEILTEKINRLIVDKEYYQNLCESTNEDKKRFVFDWNKKFMEFVEKLMNEN
ncbi:MAG: glycosyltransferase involved in cell wall biosynthesis [Nitrospinales bacterium]|jgi:glycosyltransferase involved in cell wall biosynthesis